MTRIEKQLSATTMYNKDEKEEEEEEYDQQLPDLYQITERVQYQEGMTSLENPIFERGMVTSISSVSLPDDEVLKTLETLETGFDTNEFDTGFYIEAPENPSENDGSETNLDSFLYLKIKDLKTR